MLAYWSEAGDYEVLRRARIVAPVTAADGFPSRAEIIERYARRTGIDPSDVGWYQAFAYFKLAVVCQGIAARAAGGAMVGAGFDNARAARRAAGRGGPPAARRAPRRLSRRLGRFSSRRAVAGSARDSRRAIAMWWTSSGPSAICRIRATAYSSGSSVSCATPAPPCAWIARSITQVATSGAATLIADTSIRAPRFPTVSISHAVLSTSRRTCSIRTRASEIQRWTTPCSMIGRPNVDALRGPLAHHLERALGHPDRAHRVVDPARAESLLGDPEPVALVAEEVRRGDADVVVDDLRVAAVRSVVVAEQARGALDLDAGRVLRHEDHALAPVALARRGR